MASTSAAVPEAAVNNRLASNASMDPIWNEVMMHDEDADNAGETAMEAANAPVPHKTDAGERLTV